MDDCFSLSLFESKLLYLGKEFISFCKEFKLFKIGSSLSLGISEFNNEQSKFNELEFICIFSIESFGKSSLSLVSSSNLTSIDLIFSCGITFIFLGLSMILIESN